MLQLRTFSVFTVLLAAAALATPPAGETPSPTLTPGAKAPPFAATRWFSAIPTTSMERGKVYVLLLWTVDDPGADRILAHLAGLDHPDPDVVCIAIHDVAPTLAIAEIERWVDDRRAWLHLTVGADELRATRAAWMDAAGLKETPAAFIINRDGRIAYAGPPTWIDGPLAEVRSGDWEFEKAAGHAESLDKRCADILALSDTDPRAFLEQRDGLAATYPLAFADRPGLRIRALRRTGRDQEARDWTNTLTNDLMMRRDAAAMLDIAEAHLAAVTAAGGKPSPADLTVTRHTASLADQLAGEKSAAAKAALAEAWSLAEGYPHAITEITRAIELEQDPATRTRYESLRRKYGAVEAQRSKPRRR